MKIEVAKPKVSNDDNEDYVVVPRNRELQLKEADRSKRLRDLPVPPNKMNAISLVIAYTSFGLCDEDIASILNMELEQIQRIRMLDEYSIIRTDILNELRKNDVDAVRSLISDNSKQAARKIGELIHHPDPTVAIVASKDVLDRSGHRPVDVVEHKHTMEGGLTITYVKKDTRELPVIDINFKET